MSLTRRNGFTLIEVLVAFAILVLALTTLLRVFSTGLDSIGVAERYALANMLARSVLDEVGAEIPLVADEVSGDASDGYTYDVQIARSRVIAPIVNADSWLVPYDVAVTITWRSGSLTFTTLRLASESVPTIDGEDADQ